jgi:hypothetical protein
MKRDSLLSASKVPLGLGFLVATLSRGGGAGALGCLSDDLAL